LTIYVIDDARIARAGILIGRDDLFADGLRRPRFPIGEKPPPASSASNRRTRYGNGNSQPQELPPPDLPLS
jgi:hypothetical protein